MARPTTFALPDKLRGQFSIIVETAAETFAITDFGCSRPVFYFHDTVQGVFRLSFELRDLAPLSSGHLNAAALFFHVARGGIGIEPFYDDIHGLFPATVTRFHGSQVESAPYLDWGEFLETRPIAPQAAEETFVRIASEYLGALLQGTDRVGCLFSGGTDSALMGWLLKRLGKNVVCLTADYRWKRYSEFCEASQNALDLGLPQKRIVVTRGSHNHAFRMLNSGVQNTPCGHSQSPALYQLAGHALENGINRLVTGDHADALFLGFDRLFHGFPPDLTGYTKAISALAPDEKLSRIYRKPALPAEHEELLTVFGYTTRQCFEWQLDRHRDDWRNLSKWASVPLPVLQQLHGQIWAGIPWQNIFLPITQAFQNNVEFVSPFYDLEMVKFALSLPLEYKFKDGMTKALLRTVLEGALKRSIVKRASPNPSRVWSLLPSFAHRRAMILALRPVYDRLCLSNLRHRGGLSAQIDKTAALGIWLASHGLAV